MGQPAKYPVRHIIENLVYYPDAFFGFIKFVVVIPEPVGSCPLLVYKRNRLTYMLYFRKPFSPAEKWNLDDILDNKAVKHGFRNLGNNFKVKLRRRDTVEVSRCPDESPGLCNRCSNFLLSDYSVHNMFKIQLCISCPSRRQYFLQTAFANSCTLILLYILKL